MPSPSRIAAGLCALAVAGCRGGGGVSAPVDAGIPDGPRGVYALTEGPTDPLVARLCEALHGTRYRRRAECCTPGQADGGAVAGRDGGGGVAVAVAGDEAARCTRLLGAAVRGGAARVEASEVERCEVAMGALYESCAWVGYEPLPAPVACRGLVHGRLARGSGCRSSEECEGGQHCEGLSADQTGTCRPPHGHFAPCAPPFDPLAELVLDDHLDESHPFCAGHCERGRCCTPITPAGPCEKSEQCAPGYHCARQRCMTGWLPKLGQACRTACERPARCLHGTCTAPGPEGTPCAIDDECVGRCIRAGDSGRCGPPCSR